MFKNKTIGVVIPAYNEELLIKETLKSIPVFIDKIIVIDDGSVDNTRSIINKFSHKNKKIILIINKKNQGLGKSLAYGYQKALKLNLDITAVMAGDNQMDPHDLKSIIMPIANGSVDYAKGNRLLVKNVSNIMPKSRFIGNIVATFLTKFATGYWPLIDPQCGYTAISKRALEKIDISTLKRGYGYNADILNRLNIFNFKITDIEVRPIYGKEKSGIKFLPYTIEMSFFLTKLFLKRLRDKYLIRDFHPIILFYILSFTNLILIAIPLTIRFIIRYIQYGIAPTTTLIILVFAIMMGFFSFGFAIWLDMESNKNLFIRE